MSRDFKIRTRADLKNLPPPKWLVKNMFQQGSFNVIYGQPASGKTFVALDIGLSVATGTPFLDHAITQGSVIYLAGEGHSGLNSRVSAWEVEHGMQVETISFIGDCPNFQDRAEIAQLIKQLEPYQPTLIIVDTLARHMVGGDENSAKDMGQVIQAADALRQAFDCAVLVIHHTGKKENSERGSSALRGAADTMIEVKSTCSGMTLTCTKQKDAPEFPPIHLQMQSIILDNDDPNQERQTSCVIRRSSPRSFAKSLSKNQQSIFNALKEGPASGLGYSDLQTTSAVPAGSLNRELKALQDLGLVIHDKSAGLYSLSNQQTNDQQSPTIKSQSDRDYPQSSQSPPLGVMVIDSQEYRGAK